MSTPILAEQCSTCIHFIGLKNFGKFGDFREDIRTVCKAFSKGIPRDIVLDEFDHTKKHKGDKGITYASAI